MSVDLERRILNNKFTSYIHPSGSGIVIENTITGEKIKTDYDWIYSYSDDFFIVEKFERKDMGNNEHIITNYRGLISGVDLKVLLEPVYVVYDLKELLKIFENKVRLEKVRLIKELLE